MPLASANAWTERRRAEDRQSPTIDLRGEVLTRLNEPIDAIEIAHRQYQFNTVAQRLYDFFGAHYCDWFVEAAKTEIFADDEARKKCRVGGN